MVTSHTSAAAIRTIPALSQRPGVTAESSTPSVTQLSADNSAPAASPASVFLLAQARTNSGIAASAASGRAPRIAHPSATAARIGMATSARSVRPVAVSDT